MFDASHHGPAYFQIVGEGIGRAAAGASIRSVIKEARAKKTGNKEYDKGWADAVKWISKKVGQ